MSRTWRDIPDSGMRDYDNRNYRWCAEEKKGRVHNTKRVRDKDNHGCTYNTPKWWRKMHYQKCRSLTNDRLNKLVNENYKNPTQKDFGDVVLPKPKMFQPYYW